MPGSSEIGVDAQTSTSEVRPSQYAPVVSLPKSGGAIRGIGEKFAANPVNGSGALTVPLAISPGRAGFGPQLSLAYDSGSGNGAFGFGWTLALPSITRKTDKGVPQYRDALESDTYILSNVEDLVPCLVKSRTRWVPEVVPSRSLYGAVYDIQRYRPRIEALFARIERWTSQTDHTDVFWRTISADNVTTWYGKTANSRIADPADAMRIFSWLICESYDDQGNVIVYTYKAEDSAGVPSDRVHESNRSPASRTANRYIKRIHYGNRTPYFPTLAVQPPATPLPLEWMFEVVFDYGEHHDTAPAPEHEQLAGNPPREWAYRSDPFSSYRAGFEVRTYRLCQRVLMFHHFRGEATAGPSYLVRGTDATYSYERDPSNARNPIFSFLLSVTQAGYRRRPDGTYLKRALPALEFTYTDATIQTEVQVVDADQLDNLPIGLDGRQYQWVDLDGEGASGILTEQATGWFYKRNLSPLVKPGVGQPVPRARFAPLEPVAHKPMSGDLRSGRQQFIDLAGDGQLDLVQFGPPVPGYFERTFDGDWKPLQPFLSLPNVDWNNPNLRLVDLTGDGHADVLITETDVLTWHPSLGEMGFGSAQRATLPSEERSGPRLVFADGTQTVFLADLSGDGLTDLVRIRNGEVCYWPNLGYGRFGNRVTMDNAPHFAEPDQFDPGRLRLADVDGSGLIDILYLGREGVSIYFNQSGNSWAPGQRLQTPPVDNVTEVQVVDLLGNGTACLVWSSPLPGDNRHPLRYIDLMGDKPHLLTEIRNNLGAETLVHYSPSTHFYLADKFSGTQWITRLPFPVHVVERVDTYDRISRNHFVTRYAYHHGYFDGAEEREFRGFGMVEQWDSEAYGTLSASGAFPEAVNVNADSHVPPVHTKSWFHLGAYEPGERLSQQFAHEYYGAPARDDPQFAIKFRAHLATLLPDTILPEGWTAEEQREACRALKGSLLRQEVFADDGTARASHIYMASERNYTVELLQPRAGNRHAVFQVHPREILNHQLERDPLDPRLSHEVVLQVDQFGNVLRSAAIGYPRRMVAGRLPEQNETHLTFTVSQFANRPAEPDWFRLGMPVERRTYEVVNPPIPGSRSGAIVPLTFETLSALTERLLPLGQTDPVAALLVPSAQWDWRRNVALPPAEKLRLVEHARRLYRRNSLSRTPLALGQIESMGLLFESYQLALTSELLATLLQRAPRGGGALQPLLPAPAAMLVGQKADQGGYVDLDGKGQWWIPSGRSFYSPGSSDTPAQELAEARIHFYLPRRITDPFGQSILISYDRHDLLALETEDALGNRTTAGERDDALPVGDPNRIANRNDYRTLQPALITDPNGNRTAVAYDTLGLIVGTGVMGKLNENLGDALRNFKEDLDPAEVQAFFADPKGALTNGLLGTATIRIIYDISRYERLGDPNSPPFAATLVRETHSSDAMPQGGLKIQVSFSFSDGFGREIQKKLQAEPGPMSPDGPRLNSRWVGSGWLIVNVKGQPVRQYEPFFSATHDYEFARLSGVSSISFYDALGRLVAALYPNHSYAKTVFGTWQRQAWDANDTVAIDPQNDNDVGQFIRRLAPSAFTPSWRQPRLAGQIGTDANQRVAEKSAAQKALAHSGTCTVIHYDGLGRVCRIVSDNGLNAAGHAQHFTTRTRLDVVGQAREVIDARGRLVVRYDYDLVGNSLHQASMEAGERWLLADARGQPIRAWDSRGHNFRFEYDALRRITHRYVSGHQPANPAGEINFERVIYGEGQANATASNLFGRIYRQYDSAGLATNVRYDFKGNLLVSTRRLRHDYRSEADWSQKPVLNSEIFTSRLAYDAFNRPVQLVAPHAGQRVDVIQPTYNAAGLLEKLDVWEGRSGEPAGLLPAATASLTAILNIGYDAKGRRAQVEYGNGAITQYAYDPQTFRIVSLVTTRPARKNGLASQLFTKPSTLQDLAYVYDPVGNLTYYADRAVRTIVHNNQRVEPVSDFTYDALYRLTMTEGREHIGQTAFDFAPPVCQFQDYPFVGRANPNDLRALRKYTETFEYDPVGNIEKASHAADGGRWTRTYAYQEPSLLMPAQQSNRLTSTRIHNGINRTETYNYQDDQGEDSNGCITAINTMRLTWDFKEQLRQVDLGGGGIAYYVYDSAGQRVRKVIERQNGTPKDERLYLAGAEINREYDGTGTVLVMERNTLHIIDEQHRVAIVDAQTIQNRQTVAAPIAIRRFQLGNHLGSASLELDEHAQVITYEEYFAYGCTSFCAGNSVAELSLKRYRYTAKERDNETGLYYHGARYYMPWLGRWSSCDPTGLKDSTNHYLGFLANPLRYTDPNGQANVDQDTTPNSNFTPAGSGWLRYSGIAIDEPKAVGASGISNQEAMNRAMDVVNNRQLLDRMTNSATKGSFEESHNRQPLPATSVVDQPSAVFRPSLGTVKEWKEMATIVSKSVSSRLNGIDSPKKAKEILNEALRAELKNPKTEAGKLFANALKSQTGVDTKDLFAPDRLARRLWSSTKAHAQGFKGRASQAAGSLIVLGAKAANAANEAITARDAEKQAVESLEQKLPDIVEYLSNNPKNGVLVVTVFNILQPNENSPSSTKFSSQYLITGEASQEAAEDRYFSSDRLGQAYWGQSRENVSLRWIPPFGENKPVPIGPLR